MPPKKAKGKSKVVGAAKRGRPPVQTRDEPAVENIEVAPPQVEPVDEMAETAPAAAEGPEPAVNQGAAAPVQGNPQEGGDIAAGMARALRTVFTEMAQAGNYGEDRTDKIQRRFRAMEPPTFKADGDPIEAEQWITSIERIFKIMHLYEDDLRIENAMLFLKGNAGEWWKSYEALHEEGVDELTWEEFRDLFLDQYFSETSREKKREEFYNLQQQSMTVDQYQQEFSNLARYAPDLVSTEVRKVRKFVKGLRPSIKTPVASNLHKIYKDCVDSAREVESSILERQQAERGRSQQKHSAGKPKQGVEDSSTDQKGGQQNSQQRFHNKQRKRQRDSFPQALQPQTLPAPSTASGTTVPTCFTCNQPGHYARDCPVTPTCRICGTKGHSLITCPEAFCSLCRKRGHTKRACPQNNPGNAQTRQGGIPQMAPSSASFQGPGTGTNRGRPQGAGSSQSGGQRMANRGSYQQGQTSQARNYAIPQVQNIEPTEPTMNIPEECPSHFQY